MPSLSLHLPDREQTLAFHRQRWAEVVDDRRLAALEERIETNAWGHVVMTPPPKFIHSRRQAQIAGKIEKLIGGYSATECGIITRDGVKICDAVWLSESTFARLADQSVLEEAPEICVEILSPSNTSQEIQNKFSLYFDAGAAECWLCDLEGRMTYHTADAPTKAKTCSPLCPDFPEKV